MLLCVSAAAGLVTKLGKCFFSKLRRLAKGGFHIVISWFPYCYLRTESRCGDTYKVGLRYVHCVGCALALFS